MFQIISNFHYIHLSGPGRGLAPSPEYRNELMNFNIKLRIGSVTHVKTQVTRIFIL